MKRGKFLCSLVMNDNAPKTSYDCKTIASSKKPDIICDDTQYDILTENDCRTASCADKLAECDLITLKDLGYDDTKETAISQKTVVESSLLPLNSCSMNPGPSTFCMETSEDLFELKRLTRKRSLPIAIPDLFSDIPSEPFSPDVSEYEPPNEILKQKSQSDGNKSTDSSTNFFWSYNDVATVMGQQSEGTHILHQYNRSVSNNPGPLNDAYGDPSEHCKVKKRNMPKKTNPGRKRSRDPENWKENIMKAKKNRGEEFVNKRGKLIEAKTIRPPCKENCIKKCKDRISEDKRMHIFKSFWSIGNYNNQVQYLSRCVERFPKKTVVVTKIITSRRNWTYSYHFNIDRDKTYVCKTMFLNTLGISDKWITTMFKKINEKGDDCISLEDQRGRNHQNHPNKVPDELRISVREHISQIHFVESHYVRAKTTKKYFEQHLTFPRLYRLYKEWYEDANYSPQFKASERQYRDIFYNEYNIGFFRPKKDLCLACDIYDKASPEEKIAASKKHSFHIASKFVSRQLKTDYENIAKTNPEFVVATYDLQKILITPMSDVSPFYYRRKLAVYNFTIFDIGKNEGFCYMWNETIGKKGPNEISSCVFAFIEMKVKQGLKQFVFFSDNCGGQNKNRIIFAMYAFAAQKYNIDITHIYFEVGHTQNEGDSMHSVIEKRKQNQVIYVPDQWVTLVRCAKITGKPYVVFEVSQNEIFDFKILMNSLPNTDFSIDNSKIKWTEVSYIKFFNNSSIVQIGYELYTEAVILIDFCNKPASQRKSRKRIVPFAHPTDLSIAYTEIIPVSFLKYKDLMHLCKTNAIPAQYHDYYKNLKYTPDNNDDADDSD